MGISYQGFTQRKGNQNETSGRGQLWGPKSQKSKISAMAPK